MSFDPYGYNPQQSPQDPSQPPPSDGTAPVPVFTGDTRPSADRARERVMLPGVFLIVTAVLNLVWVAGLGLGWGFYGNFTPELFAEVKARMNPRQQAQIEEIEAKLAEDNMDLVTLMRTFGTWLGISGGVALIASLIMLLAGIRMVMLRSYGLCILGSVIAAVPIVSGPGCCCIGQGVGIWALVILLASDTRAAFR